MRLGICSLTASDTYTYDAESRIGTVNGTAATYFYQGDGQRTRKALGTNTTDYVYANGQPIAEQKANGDWSDYIYAGSRRLARADTYEDDILLQGTNSSAGLVSAFTFSSLPGVLNYIVQSGDKVFLREAQTGAARGGMCIYFTDTSNTNWVTSRIRTGMRSITMGS